MKPLTPEVSRWYTDAVNGTLFEVVAIDDSGTIEVQYIDGEVGEFDLASWKNLLLNPALPPEDWRSPFELPAEDEFYSDDPIVPDDWSGPLSKLEPDLVDFGDDFSVL